MFRYIILLHLLLAPVLLLCQSKRDHTWLLGYPTFDPNHPNVGKFGGMKVHFTQTSSRVDTFNFIAGSVSATVNDENGNLLFYTTGCAIYNPKAEIIENGDEINLGGTVYQDNCVKYRDYTVVRSGAVALPIPEKQNEYIMFHLRIEQTSDISALYDQFYCTKINMNANGGHGKVLAKNQVIIKDSLHDAVSAVRHGNGRDWWVVIPRGIGREFWEILLSPEGLAKPILRSVGANPPFNVTIEDPTLPPPDNRFLVNEYTWESWAGQTTFSPDGTKFCRIVKGTEVEIYGFDRCTGEMTLLRALPMPLYVRWPNFPVQACGAAFSPDSRYLYFNNNEALFQFDVCPERIKDGGFERIEDWDGYTEDGTAVFATLFYQMRNAPDGKIYMNCNNGVRSLHVIHEPNQPGKACRFEQRGFPLPRWNAWLLNYFPNFNLYDVQDSPCDTLGIDDPNPPKPAYTFEDFRIFPNPSDQEVKLYAPDCNSLSVEVWNIMGQLVKEIAFIPGKTAYSMDVSDWAAGAYFVVARIDSRKPVTQKLIVTH